MADTMVVFKALQIANEQRNAYGLRYNDFARYRKHCANRTHRLRSTLKMTHGKGREFKKLPPLTPEIVKDGHLQLLLLEAERAWAYSQELSSLALLPANADQASTLRHSATGRFRRAVNWSTQLLSLCQSLYASSRLSAENLLQVTVYTLILNGRFLRYRDEFDDALIQLSVARGLLDELAASASTSRDQALATLFSDEVGPEIRYCAHELGRTKAYDIDGIVGEVAGKNRNHIVEGCDTIIKKLKSEGDAAGKAAGRKKLAELTWEDQPVPVRNPELVDVLLKVQEAEHRLDGFQQGSSSSTSKKGVAAYDAILLALSDAEEVARKLVEAQQLSGSSSTAPAGARDIHFVHAYIVYQLLSRRIQRDLLLVTALLSSESTPVFSPAVVKLLDTVLQSLNQMRALSVVDDSPDLASAVEARLSFTKARRCLFLARSYAPAKKYAEALTLIQHASIHVRETHSTLSLSDADPISAATPSFYPLSSESVSELESALASEGLQFKRDWFAFNGGSVDSTAKLDKKPLFFDIAVNYVALDMAALRARAGLQPIEESQVAAQPVAEKRQAAKEDAVVEAPESKTAPAPSRGGLSSLLGGWWGRS
ncbi:Signal recognition particle subunit SRP68 [Mycena venus]|uniref:Signal recognition particle subunit SRP68 n=1 Tax=Mycena venus TaxID=2733690 RepID=A0A8H6XGY0_9AGAR|nr:Signal recognition particle subunit SRP68 [Mycena venus]